MKIKKYYIALVFAFIVLCGAFEYKYIETEAINTLNVYNENVYDALNEICNISLEYNIKKLQMVSDYFYQGMDLEYLLTFFDSIKNYNGNSISDTYIILEDGFFACTKNDSDSMYDTFTQEELEDVDQLYDDIKKSLSFTCHDRFVQGKEYRSLYMGMPIFSSTHKFIGAIVIDVKSKEIERVINNIISEIPVEIIIKNNGNDIYKNEKFDPNRKIGTMVTYKDAIQTFNLDVEIYERLNSISSYYSLMKLLIILLLLATIIEFVLIISSNKSNEQHIKEIYYVFITGIILGMLNLLSYYFLEKEINDLSLITSMNFTQAYIDEEVRKNETDPMDVYNMIELDTMYEYTGEENFISYVNRRYDDTLNTLVNYVETLSCIYVYDSHDNMSSYPPTDNLKYHILPEKYLKECKGKRGTAFYKEMTDMNAQDSFAFILKPYFLGEEYVGTIAMVYDNKKINTLIRDCDFINTIEKNIITRDGKMVNLDETKTKSIFTDWEFLNNGIWNDGYATKKNIITYTLKNNKKNLKQNVIETRYNPNLISFEGYIGEIYIGIIELTVANIFIFFLIYVLFIRTIYASTKRKEILKTTQEEYEVLKDNKNNNK